MMLGEAAGLVTHVKTQAEVRKEKCLDWAAQLEVHASRVAAPKTAPKTKKAKTRKGKLR